MTHSWWWLVVDALAVYRVTILVTQDTIMQPFRNFISRWAYGDVNTVDSKAWEPTPSKAAQYAVTLITCPWCISIWFAAVVVVLTVVIPGQWQYLAAVLVFSAVTGFLAERTEH